MIRRKNHTLALQNGLYQHLMKKFYNRSIFATSLLLLALLLCNTSVNGQLITNGDMEAWTGNCPVNTAPDAWTNYSTGLGPDQGGTGCVGSTAAHGGSSYMNLVWINSGLREGATQNVTGLTLGNEYRISFWGINSNGVYADPGDVGFEIYMNSLPVFSTGNITPAGGWIEYSYTFIATALSEVIGVRVKDGTSGTSGSAGVDDFQVTELVGVRDAMMHEPSISLVRGQYQLLLEQGDYFIEDLKGISLTITNLTGQTVMSKSVDFNNGIAVADVSHLRSGIYVGYLEIEGHPTVIKFIVD